MYNEGYGNTAINQTLMNAKSELPVMQELIEVFEKELAGFNEISSVIKSKVQNIYRWNEPPMSEADVKTKNDPQDAIGRLRSLMKLFSEYNQRLVDISNHLSKIA